MEDEYNLSNIIGKRLEAALGELGDLLWAYVVLSKKDIACIFGVTNYPSEWVKKYQ
ncbi:TPA: LuxR family transcriptional regulator, partial [Serratia marcescens]|nr:LuxR family transcriptional regulator [Serratia marcescens]